MSPLASQFPHLEEDKNTSSRLMGYITWNLPCWAPGPVPGTWQVEAPASASSYGHHYGHCQAWFSLPTAKYHTEARGWLLGHWGRIPGCPRSTPSFPQSPLKPLLCPRQQTVLEVPQGQDRAPGTTKRPLVENTPRNYRLGKLPCRDRAGHCAGRSQGGQGRPLREGRPKIVSWGAINRPQCKAKQRRKQKRTQIFTGICYSCQK
jgi:hypothetical protein